MTTDISLDHSEILGQTLAEIAREKAGIVKPGVPHLVGLLPREAEKVVRQICRERKAPMIRLLRRDFKLHREKLRFDYRTDDLALANLSSPLMGTHQLSNCALALKSVCALRKCGFSIPVSAIRMGLKSTDWPGRFHILRGNDWSPTVVLDVCHNPSGAAAFADTFARVFPGRRSYVLVGFVKRKQHQALVDEFSRVTKAFWVVPLHTKRTSDVRELIDELDWHDIPVSRAARMETAYTRLRKTARDDDIISVVGSHYLVGEFLRKYVWK